MEDSIEFSFKLEGKNSDILLAFLSELPFNGFMEDDVYVMAYISEENVTEDFKLKLEEIKHKTGLKYYISKVTGKNWNEEWERNYEPIIINEFCGVRAHFHPFLDNVKHEIIVTPQMSFGTGHHETTYMMMSQMEKIDFKDKTVFDYGCGTGILAILAMKLEARFCMAIDIDPICTKNTSENIERNNVENISILTGDKSIVPDQTFDIILANINRNILLDSMELMHNKLGENGILMMSGIMLADKLLMIDAIERQGFEILEITNKGQWICILCKK